jgi:hypothetical protein
MSRTGVFYVVKAMEMAAMGKAAAGAPRVPARRAVAREAPAADRADGGARSRWRRVLAAVRRGMGSAPGRSGRSRRRLGGAAQPD